MTNSPVVRCPLCQLAAGVVAGAYLCATHGPIHTQELEVVAIVPHLDHGAEFDAKLQVIVQPVQEIRPPDIVMHADPGHFDLTGMAITMQVGAAPA